LDLERSEVDDLRFEKDCSEVDQTDLSVLLLIEFLAILDHMVLQLVNIGFQDP